MESGREGFTGSLPPLSEKLWMLIILLFSASTLLFTYICLYNGITIVFMHVYYIPIILMAYHYRDKGVVFSAILGAFYILITAYFTWPEIHQIFLALERSVIFILVAAVVAWLSGRLEKDKIFFETLSDISPVGIIRTDPEGICLYANRRFSEITGIPGKEITGKELSGSIYREDMDKFTREWSACIREGGKMILEHRFEKPDGETAWVLCQVSSERNGTGIITGYIATITDLSRIKTAEQFQRTQFAFDHSPDEIYFVDRKGEIVYANISARNSFGITSENDKIRKTVFEINPEITRKIWDEQWREMVEKSFMKSESTHRSIDGALYPVEITRYHINFDGVDYSCAIARDITERKEAESEIREKEEKYRTLAEASLDPIYIISPDDTILYANTRAAELLNIPVEHIIGKPRTDLFPRDIAKGQKESLQKVFENGEPLRIERRIVYNGHEYWQDHSLVPLKDKNGKVTSILGVSHDITDRKKAEQSLKDVNRKLNLLSSITRHDILNQVTGAAGYIEILEMDKEIQPGTKAEEYIKKISTIIDKIKRQIQFTGYYKDLGEKEPGWFNIGKIVADTYSSMAPEHIELQNHVRNVEVLADPLFQKVIYNLFDNAIKHGEKITSITFSATETDEGLIVTCEDDGIGIPDDVKEKIFSRGYYKNSGLGLFLSKGILSITGLDIRETGKFGEGARFEIIVPEDSYRFTE